MRNINKRDFGKQFSKKHEALTVDFTLKTFEGKKLLTD